MNLLLATELVDQATTIALAVEIVINVDLSANALFLLVCGSCIRTGGRSSSRFPLSTFAFADLLCASALLNSFTP